MRRSAKRRILRIKVSTEEIEAMETRRRIVLTASEAVPFSKTGGLADVIGALAGTLSRMGHDVVMILPDYYLLRQRNRSLPRIVDTGLKFSIDMNGREMPASVNWTTLPGTDVRVFLIRQPEYFDRPQLYQENGHGYVDNCARYCFFSRAVLEVCRQMVLRPDVIHCNDWQTGLIPALLNTQYARLPGFENTSSIMTIHNMAYQGRFWHFDMPLTGMGLAVLQLPPYGGLGRYESPEDGDFVRGSGHDRQPDYAREICTSDGGYGLEGTLRHRQRDLRGILNGIDDSVWNPATDSYLPAPYSLDSIDEGKPRCKEFLQSRMGLPVRREVPLLGMVSRMTDQKGFDLITEAAERLLSKDVQLAFLGTGDPHYEGQIRHLAGKYPNKVAVQVGFDESLAHQIEGGADAFLMPSRFEPCGLNQMYSLRYGTVPIVRKVGGLADSVVNLEPAQESLRSATGFVFADYDRDAWRERSNEHWRLISSLISGNSLCETACRATGRGIAALRNTSTFTKRRSKTSSVEIWTAGSSFGASRGLLSFRSVACEIPA